MSRLTFPKPQPDWALFLDFDGSIVEIAPTPQDVKVPASLLSLLAGLNQALDGAVAIVSGRSIAQIDRFLGAVVPAVAGLHGFERRKADGTIARPATSAHGLDKARDVLEAFAAEHSGIFVEDKEFAVALHYRLNPELAGACRNAVTRAIGAVDGDWDVIEGKRIFDIKPRSHTKGTAIEAFMAESPFLGRVPVFCGDDVTDEDGFAVVNAQKGVSIRIGNGTDTGATLRIDTVTDLLVWLDHVAAVIGGASPTRKERV